MTEHTKEPWTILTFLSARPSMWVSGEEPNDFSDEFTLPRSAYVHAMACVNALAGMNPEKVVLLVEACEALRASAESCVGEYDEIDLGVMEALAELKGEDKVCSALKKAIERAEKRSIQLETTGTLSPPTSKADAAIEKLRKDRRLTREELDSPMIADALAELEGQNDGIQVNSETAFWPNPQPARSRLDAEAARAADAGTDRY